MFVASGLGLGALWRRRRDRGERLGSAGQLRYHDGPDPAEELRAKLAEAKVAHDEGAPEVERADEGSPLDPQSRRHELHERARASIDELG